MIKHLTPHNKNEIQEYLSKCSLFELINLVFSKPNISEYQGISEVELFLNKKLNTTQIFDINVRRDWIPTTYSINGGPENGGRGLVTSGKTLNIFTMTCLIECNKLHWLLQILYHETKDVSILSYELGSQILKIQFKLPYTY